MVENAMKNRKDAGRKGKRRTAVWALLLIAFMAAAVVVFGARVRDRLFGKPLQAPAASFGHLRLPLDGERFAYQTMLAMRSPDRPKARFPVRAEGGDLLEFGLVRIGGEFAEPCDYVFTVHALTDNGREKLLETSEEFPVNRWRLFRAEPGLGSDTTGRIELEYSLKPKGLRERIAAAIATAMGRSYWKDFAFVAPNVVRKRKADELNVLLVVFDTLRADRLGCLGYDRPTSPNIDAFAREGVLFTHAVSPSPWTLPAHFSLLTGLYPSAQLDGDAGGWETRSYAEKLMPDILGETGYYTVAVGSLPHASGFGKGFDLFRKFNYVKVARKSHTTRRVFSNATEWLAENRDRKFFMLLHNYECHIPYEGTFFPAGEGAGLAETRDALYDGDVRSLDGLFGELIEKLRALDLLSNTIVIVTSDHGEHFYDHFTEQDRIPPGAEPVPEVSNLDHGHSLHEELIRVPIIFHIPGLEPEKRVFDNRVRLTDVMPTILEHLDIAHDGPTQGQSLIGLMKHGDRPDEPPAMSEFTFSGAEQKAVILNGYKYLYTENPDEKKGGVGYRDIPRHALYDLKKDPGEKNNIYEQNRATAEELRAALEEMLAESSDINARLKAKRGAKGSEPAALPGDVIESLEALGYLKN